MTRAVKFKLVYTAVKLKAISTQCKTMLRASYLSISHYISINQNALTAHHQTLAVRRTLALIV